ncbi:MAG: hypothetical protein LBS11_12295 [Oscillospiraceae bacterium]|nr:hypothetical protein [Oscillospiraceae bacterium]
MRKHNRAYSKRGRTKCAQNRLARLRRVYNEQVNSNRAWIARPYAIPEKPAVTIKIKKIKKSEVEAPSRKPITVSTYEELRDTLASASTGSEIQLINDITVTSGLAIPANRSIYLTSDPNNNRRLTRGQLLGGDMVTVLENAQLFLSRVTLDGNQYGVTVGSGALIAITHTNARVYLYSGSELENNRNDFNSGGAVRIDGAGLAGLSIDGGVIRHNTVTQTDLYGGGVFVNKGVLELRDGEITNNHASLGGGVAAFPSGYIQLVGDDMSISENTATDGGGVYLNGAAFAMLAGDITRNNADKNGGGMLMTGNSAFSMSGGAISHNTALLDGGGIADENMVGGMDVNGALTNNTATRMGGAIYIAHDSLNRLRVGDSAVFADNHAAWSTPAHTAADALLYNSFVSPSAVWTNPLSQGYNNYDISYPKPSGGGGGSGGGGRFGGFGYSRTRRRADQVVWCASTDFCECVRNHG